MEEHSNNYNKVDNVPVKVIVTDADNEEDNETSTELEGLTDANFYVLNNSNTISEKIDSLEMSTGTDNLTINLLVMKREGQGHLLPIDFNCSHCPRTVSTQF